MYPTRLPDLTNKDTECPVVFEFQISNNFNMLFPISHVYLEFTFNCECCILSRNLCVLTRFSHVWLCATLWTVAPQAPLSMGFFRQRYWSGLLCLPPGALPNPGINLSLLFLLHCRWILYPLSHWGSFMRTGILFCCDLPHTQKTAW